MSSAPADRPPLEDLVVITGVSGAGKSTAMQVFEDAGYFCVDNLPPEMIRGLVELFLHEGSKVRRAAVVSDARGGAYFEQMSAVLDELDAAGVDHRVVFLDASREAVMTRYKETRRRHPLSPEGSVAQGIADRARADRAAARARRPGRRLDRAEGARAAPQARRRDAAARERDAHGGDVRELRLQERAGARRGHRARRALSAEPALRRPSCGRSPAATSGSSTTSPRTATSRRSTSGCCRCSTS